MNIIWVATTGNDSTGIGNRTAPYATIEYAIQQMVSGDQVRILDGTYIPTDSVVVSGLDGSIFAENPGTVFIQPEKTRLHQAGVAILDANRFSVYGINVLQAADTSGNLIGIYVENVETFLAHTCAVSDFEIPSGSNGYGIFASGSLGRIEKCRVSNMTGSGEWLYGIYTQNIDQIECDVDNLIGVAGSGCKVRPVILEGFRPGPTPPTPTPPLPYDADPKMNWWWFPDPNIGANNAQRLYTGPQIGLDLQDFTAVTMLRSPVGVTPSHRAPVMGYYGATNDGVSIARSWAFESYTGNWQGWVSNDGANPSVIVKMSGVGDVADQDLLFGFTYHYNAPPGGNSDASVYWNQLATGKRTATVANMEGPPVATGYPFHMLGMPWTVWHTRCWWGRAYWYALFTRKFTEGDFDSLYSGATMPYDDPDVAFYVDFRQTPAPMITPNIDNFGIGDLNVHNWANMVLNGP